MVEIAVVNGFIEATNIAFWMPHLELKRTWKLKTLVNLPLKPLINMIIGCIHSGAP